MRKRERGIALSQAQHELAREYGFASLREPAASPPGATTPPANPATSSQDKQAAAAIRAKFNLPRGGSAP
jgi:hypothetical protein